MSLLNSQGMRFSALLFTLALANASLLWSQNPLPFAREIDDQKGHRNAEIHKQVVINNRILACPNDTPLSVMDLTRKLDLLFLQQFPEYAESTEARYQFYQMAWRRLLDEMINNELILADAEERELKVSEGEVHRTVEEMFGPDVVHALDQLGMSYDEAREMVEKDLIVSQMRGYMVFHRAVNSVAPSMVAEAYQKFAQASQSQKQWHYRVLSIRHPEQDVAWEIAQLAQQLLEAAEVYDLERVVQQLEAKKRTGCVDERAAISVTALQERTLDSLASSHRDALIGLNPGQCSEPAGQRSRYDRCMVYRIFYLVDRVEPTPPPFQEVEAQLRQKLVEQAAQEHQKIYIQRLRTDYGITEDYLAQMIPENFTPYQLR